MEYKTDALLLKSIDVGENDKLATLLTAERGKIVAKLKGVKKAGAKLKFAAQPFCFAEYGIVEKSGYSTVVSAYLHQDFFALREDIVAFYAGASVLEISEKLSPLNAGGEFLLSAVSALFKICEEKDRAGFLIEFFLNALKLAGYPVETKLSAPPPARLFFDMEKGAFSLFEGTPVSLVTYITIQNAERSFGAFEIEGEKRALRLLSAYFSRQTGEELLSVSELLKLL